jgi:hypothetical protein
VILPEESQRAIYSLNVVPVMELESLRRRIKTVLNASEGSILGKSECLISSNLANKFVYLYGVKILSFLCLDFNVPFNYLVEKLRIKFLRADCILK